MLLSDTINELQTVQTLLALRSPDFLSSSNQLSFYAWEVINFKVTDKPQDLHNQTLSAYLKRSYIRNTWLKLLVMYSYSMPLEMIDDFPVKRVRFIVVMVLNNLPNLISLRRIVDGVTKVL